MLLGQRFSLLPESAIETDSSLAELLLNAADPNKQD